MCQGLDHALTLNAGKVDSKSFEDWREHTDSVRTQLQRLQPQHRGHVPDRYLMMHGGIGRLEWLSEIAAVKRPLHSCKHHAKYADVLSELVGCFLGVCVGSFPYP